MCNKIYIDETSRMVNKLFLEHIQDFKLGDIHYGLSKYYLEIKHGFNFKNFKMFVKIHNNQQREIAEFSIISNHNQLPSQLGL